MTSRPLCHTGGAERGRAGCHKASPPIFPSAGRAPRRSGSDPRQPQPKATQPRLHSQRRCFAVDRARAKHLQARFNHAGVPAAYIDAYAKIAEREEIAAYLQVEVRIPDGKSETVRCLELAHRVVDLATAYRHRRRFRR